MLNILAAIFELCQDGILKKVWKVGEEGGDAIFDLPEIVPAQMVLSPTGRRLYDLAGLATIGDSNELQRVADLLATVPCTSGIVLPEGTALRNK